MIAEAELDRIVARMRRAGLVELDFRDGDDRLLLRLDPAVAAQAGETLVVRAPGIGRFRPSHPRRPDAGIAIGNSVAAGDALGWLEAGTTLVAIVAPVAGSIAEIVAEPGAAIGFHAPVLTLTLKG